MGTGLNRIEEKGKCVCGVGWEEREGKMKVGVLFEFGSSEELQSLIEGARGLVSFCFCLWNKGISHLVSGLLGEGFFLAFSHSKL